ncbi:EF-hand domain-containing protein [Tieghemostelium lacteum]|uniref:EF-hand domain-containing protein n=1 Tax=Tieghemostelium lacteum TaxID=361077 RepID=A0A151Z2W6_TIELA|nr:EF-hand domain-containing protein [Tieghemostelium lacteum]|eukprot:KYQ88288.1 EF-hand domain-containing protein [Tieghemostelium lacteum]
MLSRLSKTSYLFRTIHKNSKSVRNFTTTNSKNYNRDYSQQQQNNKSGNGKKLFLGSLAALVALGTSVTLLDDDSNRKNNPNYQRQKDTFDKFASTVIEGKKHMTANDFLTVLTTPESPEARGDQILKATLDADKFKILFQIADVDHTGYISFDEYVMFDELMAKPEAEYFLAFKLFDRDGNGKISKEDFKNVVTASLDPSIPFNFDCELVKLYFGNGKNELNYSQFTQLLKDLQQERVKQEFKFYDKSQTGYIPKDKFAKILSSVKLRKIPDEIKDKLETISEMNKQTGHEKEVSYSQFVATNDMLLHIPSYGRVLRAAIQRVNKESVTKEEFLEESRTSTSIEITPMEVDIIFHLFDYNKDGKLSIKDFVSSTGIIPKFENFVPKPQTPTKPSTSIKSHHVVQDKTPTQKLLESIENFALGSVAGGIGAAAVYPIDLVKTRMQNQRAVDPSQRVYNNSWDCFKKVVRNEGVRGLYKGLGPQMVGVAPEKAIKLTVNDLLRDLFEDKSKGEIYFPLEVLAGGFAGMSQVCVTNPLEIVKIRLQVQSSGPKVSAWQTCKELGFTGLYKGAGACLLRDIPFSAIYFPTYAKMKTVLADENGKLGATDLLIAGAVAGIPAASLVTPADVIKTRLQVKAKAGEQTYSGIRDCFVKVLKEEGPKAFFKGCVARVCRSSPQFGVTLLSYELLQNYFAPHITPRVPTNAPITKSDFSVIRGKNSAVEKVHEMESKFGI